MRVQHGQAMRDSVYNKVDLCCNKVNTTLIRENNRKKPKTKGKKGIFVYE